MTHEVYIGYAPRDKTSANAVRAVLESHGLSCWIASRDMPPGADPMEATAAAIADAKIFVLVFTANSNAAQEQIARETGLAKERALPLIGFRTANVAPNDTLKHFLNTHWIDAFVPPLDGHMRELADLVLSLLGRRGGIVPTLKAIVPAGAPALKGVAALAKALPANLADYSGKMDLRSLPALPLPTIDAAAMLDRWKRPLLMSLAALLLVGAAAAGWSYLRPQASPEESRAWQTASGTESIPAYQSYLRQFPDGYYKEQADTRLTALKTEVEAAFAKAKTANTAAAYRDFLDRYSRQGVDVEAAQRGFAAADQREKAEHAAFTAAAKAKTRAGYQAFLTQYGTSADAAEARRRMAACRVETRSVTSYEERTLEQDASAGGATGQQACSMARNMATSRAATLCSQTRGTLGAIRVADERPESDASAGGRRTVGSLLGSLFNQGRSVDLGSNYHCRVEITAACRKPVTATRPVDICP